MNKLFIILILSINISLADKILTENNVKSCIQIYNSGHLDSFSIMCINNNAYLSRNGLLKMKKGNNVIHCYCKKNSFLKPDSVVLKD